MEYVLICQSLLVWINQSIFLYTLLGCVVFSDPPKYWQIFIFIAIAIFSNF